MLKTTIKAAQYSQIFDSKKIQRQVRERLNTAAYQGWRLGQKQLENKLKSPKPFTLRSVAYKKSYRVGLDYQSMVFIRPKQSKYLGWIEKGGTQQQDNLVAPVNTQILNKFGNIPRRFHKDTKQIKGAFVITTKDGKKIVLQRTSKKRVRVLYASVSTRKYEKRLQWAREVGKAIKYLKN